MDKKVLRKPFVEKISFDSKHVIATSGTNEKECYGWMANKTEKWGQGTCSSGTAQYVGINSSAKPNS